ncbi:MAG: hypothetical protein H0W74_06050 [Sphingosinicella sp.]|nr:hypothetical protein [Sphingosinicella sp.]
MLKPIIVATAIAGTLDILSAFVFAGMAGMTVFGVLRFVASGPFGGAPTATAGWAAVGLLVHFAIMACMVTVYMLVAPHFPMLLRHPIVAGIAYGFLLWIIMYWIVRPLRWPEMPLPHTIRGIAEALFAHCILVGIPIALVASRYLGKQSAV